MALIIEKMVTAHMGLTWNFRVNPNSCNNPIHYENYLKFTALTDQRCGLAVTHILIDDDETTKEKKIAGFIALKATSLVKEYETYDEGHPALEIAELAIDKEYEKRGFGTILVQFAITTAASLNDSHIGIEYVVLCADPEAVGFYTKTPLEFKKLGDYYSLPREGWNQNCIPMLVKISSG